MASWEVFFGAFFSLIWKTFVFLLFLVVEIDRNRERRRKKKSIEKKACVFFLFRPPFPRPRFRVDSPSR